jgi:hypothetical protein
MIDTRKFALAMIVTPLLICAFGFAYRAMTKISPSCAQVQVQKRIVGLNDSLRYKQRLALMDAGLTGEVIVESGSTLRNLGDIQKDERDALAYRVKLLEQAARALDSAMGCKYGT